MSLKSAMSGASEHFGGHLECMTCHRREAVGDVGELICGDAGWPKCCGYTMRWLTARELAGKFPSGQEKSDGA